MTVVLQERYRATHDRAVTCSLPGHLGEFWALDENPQHASARPTKSSRYGDNGHHGLYQIVYCPGDLYPVGNVITTCQRFEHSIRQGYIPEGTVLRRWPKTIEHPTKKNAETITVHFLGDLPDGANRLRPTWRLVNSAGEPVPMLIANSRL